MTVEITQIELHESLAARWRADRRAVMRAVIIRTLRWTLIIAAVQLLAMLIWPGTTAFEMAYIAAIGGTFMGLGPLFFDRALVFSASGIRVVYDEIKEDVKWPDVSELVCDRDGRLLRIRLGFKSGRPTLIFAMNDNSIDGAIETQKKIQQLVEAHINPIASTLGDPGCPLHAPQ